MTPWTDREISRFQTRVVIFTRRGLAGPSAETLADRLARRDQERDDRRCCMECSRARATSCSRRDGWFLPDTLQRCPNFDWATQ